MSEVDDIINKLSNIKLQLEPSTDSASQSEEVIKKINQTLSQVENSAAGTLLNNLDIFFESNEIDMTQQFKPEYLKCVPDFDGNPNDLNRYLAVCQSIIDAFYVTNQPNNFQNVYLLNCIIGKLTGNAKLILGTQNVQTWEELKIILSRHFADQRDEACLNRDLVMLRQQNSEKPYQFYERILHILNLLCSFVNIHEADDNAKNLKRNLYNNLALKTFLSGLKEPLGTTVRCMRPKDLPEALQFVTAEYNTQYFQNLSKIPNQRQPTQYFMPTNNQNFTHTRPTLPFNTYTPQRSFNNNQSTFPSQPVPIRPNYNKIPQRFPTNAQVFKNRSNQTNVFKPNPNKQFPPPTPMSINTRQTNNTFRPNYTSYKPQFKNHFQSQANQQPNFTSEELYTTNTVNNDQYYVSGIEQNYYIDDENNSYDAQEPQYFDEFDVNQYAEPEPSQQNPPYASCSNDQNFQDDTQETHKT